MDVGVLVFAAAAVAHLVFQVVVHVVVYPGLADVACTVPGRAAQLHARYTSRMGFVVAPVYGLLAVGTAAVVLDAPAGAAGDWLPWVAVTTSAAAVLVTGLGAVPLHRALSGGALSGGSVSPERIAQGHARLRRVDLLRLVLAAGQVVAAMIAVFAA